jgi:hypothetical protein
MRNISIPSIVVFLNSKDVALQSHITEMFQMKKKHFIVSDNSLTLAGIVLAEAKKQYNKQKNRIYMSHRRFHIL